MIEINVFICKEWELFLKYSIYVRKFLKYYNFVSYEKIGYVFKFRFYIKKLKLFDIKDVFLELDFLDLFIWN